MVYRQPPNEIDPLDNPDHERASRNQPRVSCSGKSATTQSSTLDSPWLILMTLRAKISTDMAARDEALVSYLQSEILPELDRIKTLMDQHDKKLRQAHDLFIA